ncbi:glycosyltransferase family protein [soil metagenome]
MGIFEMKTGIIIQARTGSQRLPGKVLLPFDGEKNILELIISRLKRSIHGLPIVVATSISESDNAIAMVAEAEGVLCFRGDEEDVLKRFIDAAVENEFSRIIRVCADNPFLDLRLMDELISKSGEIEFDYYSYLAADDLPAIKSHWGIFTEIVSLSALNKAEELTNSKTYHEHVTNFIYENPDKFKVYWEKAPKEIFGQKDFRFTIDTSADFDLMKKIWNILSDRGVSHNYVEALKIVMEFPGMQNEMKNQIKINSK